MDQELSIGDVLMLRSLWDQRSRVGTLKRHVDARWLGPWVEARSGVELRASVFLPSYCSHALKGKGRRRRAREFPLGQVEGQVHSGTIFI